MNCPDKETMQDFIDNELPESESQPIIEHIRSCETCKTELREIITVQNVLSHIVAEDKCPSLDALEAYARAAEKSASITEHIEFCHRCRTYAWALGASEQELAAWQKKEEQELSEFTAKDLGFNTAKETLEKLLPAKTDMLEKAWQSVLDFVLDLKDKAIDSWPSFDQRTQLVGVLGFAETSDPETDAASVIMATTLYVSQLVSDGDIKPSIEKIEAAIKDVATKLGAGKELQKRLIETVPPIILKFN